MAARTLTTLAEVAATDSARLAVDGRGATITYGQLEHDVDRLAGWIAERVGEIPVAIAVRTIDACVAATAFLAIERCGHIVVPVDPAAPLQRAQFIAADVDAALILTDDVGFFGVDDRVGDVAAAVVAGRSFGLATEMPNEAIATIIFTSGSTGVPKGIVTDWRRHVVGLERIRASGWADEPGRIGLPFMGTISNSVAMLSACVAGGSTLVPYDIRSRGVQGMGLFLREERIDYFATVPTLLRVILDTAGPQDTWPSLKLVVTWGEGLTWSDVERLRRHVTPDTRIYSTYGTTEAGSVASYLVTAEARIGEGLVPAGVPNADLTVRIVDTHGHDVVDGAEGEVVVIGDDVGVEYWRRPDLSARVFRSLPGGGRGCWTGDRGRMLPDGNLQHLGRLDHMVKISGNRVDLGEIEVALRTMDDVADAGVIARVDAAGDTRLSAFITERDRRVVVAEVRSRLVRQLPGYMVPDMIHVLDELPTLPNGKIDRRTLVEIPSIPAQRSETGLANASVEAQLVTIWTDVLGHPIGVDDRFADVGADSIRAARAFAMIESTLGYDRPISLLLEAPTIAELAVRLRTTAEHWHPLVPVRTGGSRAPLFVIHGGRGDVTFAARLAMHIDSDVPVYGLQPPTLSGRVAEELGVESLARRYVDVIRAVQPSGPYYLFGYSFGGLVAFEMACGLEDVGEEVALLGIGDTPAPGAVRAAAEVRRSLQRDVGGRSRTDPLTARNLTRRAVLSVRYRVRRRVRRRVTRWRLRYYVRTGKIVPPQLRSDFTLWQLGARNRNYLPAGRSRAPVLLIQTGALGGVTSESWAPFALGPIETVVIAGDHSGPIREPLVGHLGTVLSERMTTSLTRV